jgi:hypothetical protein
MKNAHPFSVSQKKQESSSISAKLHQTQSLLIVGLGQLQKIWQTNRHSSHDEDAYESKKLFRLPQQKNDMELCISYKGNGNAAATRGSWKDRF